MYLKGLFGGVPIVDILDYDTILQELDDLSDVEGEAKVVLPHNALNYTKCAVIVHGKSEFVLVKVHLYELAFACKDYHER